VEASSAVFTELVLLLELEPLPASVSTGWQFSGMFSVGSSGP
jgi:hypothetical protein